jgi:glycosyltransferase involved in cell wall biosynthesis
VPPHQPELLATAMIAAAEDPEGSKRMAEAGRRRIRSDFGVEKMIDDYELMLERLLGHK